MATNGRKSRLAELRSKGTALNAVDISEPFRTWLREHNICTAEAVYGYFYTMSPEKNNVLNAFELNYQRLYDRLCKVISSEKIHQLNKLSQEQFQVEEM